MPTKAQQLQTAAEKNLIHPPTLARVTEAVLNATALFEWPTYAERSADIRTAKAAISKHHGLA
jgi:hypothetical protein